MRGISVFIVGIQILVPLTLIGPVGNYVRARNSLSGSAVQWVDRMHKGDRLAIPVRIIDKKPISRIPHGIVIGCELVFSPLANFRGNYSARCLT